MSDDCSIKDYCWEDSKTCAHDYLTTEIKNKLDSLRISRSSKILDAGCGGGYLLNELHEAGYENIWGIDIAESGINLAKSEYLELKDNFIVHNIYNKDLPVEFPIKRYDLIISTEVIEHLINPKKYLENIHNWLAEKGYLIITTPYHGYLKNLAIALSNKFDGHVTALWEGGHIKFFSRKTLFQILKENGFKPVDFQGCGRISYLWKSMLIVAKKI